MKITRQQIRKLINEAILSESKDGKARKYSIDNPEETVHLYDPKKSEVVVIKDGQDLKRVQAEEGTRAYRNYSNEKKGVKTFGFGSGVA